MYVTLGKKIKAKLNFSLPEISQINDRNSKNIFIFLIFTCCPPPFSFRTSLFIKKPYVSLHLYSHYVQTR